MEILTSTNHKKADRSKFDAVISLVERSAEGQNFHCTGVQRKTLNGLGLSNSPIVQIRKKRGFGIPFKKCI